MQLIQRAWSGQSTPRLLPIPDPGLAGRSWLAVNSPTSARIAGDLGFNMLFSHLRTPEQYRQYRDIYREAGGRGLIAANRPVYVGPDDSTAFARAEPMLRTLWRRFRADGKIPAATPEPDRPKDLTGHPINFIVGGPESVARQFRDLHAAIPFDVANVEVRWAGLPRAEVLANLRRLMEDVVPLFGGEPTLTPTT